MTLATIILESDDVVPELIESVVVRVYSTVGVFVTSGTTDVDGEVIFDLPDDDYDLTFFKTAVSPLDGNLQRITVDSADTDIPPNTYTVKAHVMTLPESVDPILCRISGYFRGIDGRPATDIRLNLGMCPEVAVISDFVISPQDIIEIRPDSDGYYEFDLLKESKYRVYFPQLETLFRVEPAMLLGIVPDLPALELAKFLFPVPVNAEFDPATISLSAGDEPDDTVDCTITYSDGSINMDGVRPVPPYFVSISVLSSDDEVATAEFQVDKVIITPKAPGTANITITRKVSTTYMVYDPVPAFASQTLVVTVS